MRVKGYGFARPDGFRFSTVSSPAIFLRQTLPIWDGYPSALWVSATHCHPDWRLRSLLVSPYSIEGSWRRHCLDHGFRPGVIAAGLVCLLEHEKERPSAWIPAPLAGVGVLSKYAASMRVLAFVCSVVRLPRGVARSWSLGIVLCGQFRDGEAVRAAAIAFVPVYLYLCRF